MSINRTSNLFMPLVNSFYPTISWLGITKDELIDIFSDSNINFNGSIEVVKKELNELLKERIQSILNDDRYAYDAITKYIESLVNDYTEEEVFDLFKDLDKFFKKYDYTPSKQVLGKLFKDNVLFLNMVKFIDKESGDSPEECKEIINNSSLLLILEAYYDIFNKKYEEYEKLLKDTDLADSVKVYLKDIDKFPLLTFEEEQELFKKIAEGDKQAKDRMVNCNLKLVVSMAARNRNRGLPFGDLIQEGNLGLMKAIEYFDASRGYKFSTYAWQWIRQAIGRSLGNQGRNIRLPVHMYEKIARYRKQKEILATILDREPTMEEMATRMGVDVRYIKQYESLLVDTISLNTLINDENNTELEYFVPSDNNVEDQVIRASLRKQLLISFDNADLSDRLKDIIMLRFGLIDGRCWTLAEVSQKYNITHERVRQLEARAMRKLRNPKVTKQLLDYTSNIKLAASNVGLDLNRIKKSPYRTTKTHVKEDKITMEEKEKQESGQKGRKKKFNSAYAFFDGYSEEEINKALTRLNEKDNKIFNDFNQSFLSGAKASKVAYQDFYNLVRPKIIRCLADPYYVPSYKKARRKNNNNPVEEVIDHPVLDVIEVEEKKQSLEMSVQEQEDTVDTIQEVEITKNDYSSMLELLKNPSFTDMMSVFSVKEAVIVSLRLGYIDNKYFSPKAISNFLGIEEEEVNETTKRVLLVYKDNFNDLIDKLITGSDVIKEENRAYIKLPKKID